MSAIGRLTEDTDEDEEEQRKRIQGREFGSAVGTALGLAIGALKLIEQLYKDDQIPAFVYRNILNKYADMVALSKFASAAEKEVAA